MTVTELMVALGSLPPDAMVVVRGYEGGVNEVEAVYVTTVAINYYDEDQWYYGRHQEVGLDSVDEGTTLRQAVKVG